MKVEDDKLLVRKFLQTRNENFFRQLYRQHTQHLYRLAIHLTYGDRPGSEDVIQEMWTRAIYHLAEFRWQSSFKTWLSGILINCCREHNRKQTISHTSINDLENLLANSHNTENKMDLQRALTLLPNGYREVLILHDMEGYKHEEIGILLGINEGTSKSQLFYARRAIKKLL
ncbi:MAG TPA: RNA polymerase sigma factor [Chitinophagaceae bacterium]|nr:RNA polymerase sigma factor [Chitinophagaceae bacterium]